MRTKMIRELARGIVDANDQWQVSVVNLGKAYNEGFVAGSGQSSITALERVVIVAALEWFEAYDHGHSADIDPPLLRAMGALTKVLEREATE